MSHARHHPGSCPPAGSERKRGDENQALGRSQGGLTTKIHMLADAFGRPLRFMLTGGQVHDIVTAPMLLEGIQGTAVVADKAYDSNGLRQIIADAGMRAIIPSKRSRKVQIPHDAVLYKTRNRIERCFNKLKHFRRFATRFDRRVLHFLAFIHLAAAMLWMH
ncbi:MULTISPECIES: IS5 family transposase [unclassified Mesorhizobium]|uniref:IS5 family transposase n=2 Tax=Mesorhizobium TaxID=68287 RepID=UPI002484D37E|nr:MULTISPECIES: IS5 family transposase [unclassified Mesorhizobium]